MHGVVPITLPSTVTVAPEGREVMEIRFVDLPPDFDWAEESFVVGFFSVLAGFTGSVTSTGGVAAAGGVGAAVVAGDGAPACTGWAGCANSGMVFTAGALSAKVDNALVFGAFLKNELYPRKPPPAMIIKTTIPITTGTAERLGFSSSNSSSSVSKRS